MGEARRRRLRLCRRHQAAGERRRTRVPRVPRVPRALPSRVWSSSARARRDALPSVWSLQHITQIDQAAVAHPADAVASEPQARPRRTEQRRGRAKAHEGWKGESFAKPLRGVGCAEGAGERMGGGDDDGRQAVRLHTELTPCDPPATVCQRHLSHCGSSRRSFRAAKAQLSRRRRPGAEAHAARPAWPMHRRLRHAHPHARHAHNHADGGPGRCRYWFNKKSGEASWTRPDEQVALLSAHRRGLWLCFGRAVLFCLERNVDSWGCFTSSVDAMGRTTAPRAFCRSNGSG